MASAKTRVGIPWDGAPPMSGGWRRPQLDLHRGYQPARSGPYRSSPGPSAASRRFYDSSGREIGARRGSTSAKSRPGQSSKPRAIFCDDVVFIMFGAARPRSHRAGTISFE